MFLLVSSALTLALIESSHPGSNQVVAGVPEVVNQSPSATTTGMSANNVTNGHGSFLWNKFGGGGGGSNLISKWGQYLLKPGEVEHGGFIFVLF